ncbi:GNAT family N-acetyltransferase [uncultured Sulfitobacter sp.]|uniref:GNAT family N-acetyltransferase n=1 Tax=uncultured Sulfitobacter sp. TaxID=191468 RepID=UPI0026305FE8|nr:GNAT family N-acetyltransferase [uncultured Sulfitobacter sp.]
MKIRLATNDDAAAIAQMWHLGWHQGHAAVVDAELVRLRTPQEFATRTLAHLAQCHVAESDGVLAGFFMLEGDELYQFYVGADHQGSGAATKLMAAAEAELVGRRAWLACAVGNERAAAFYRKAGWQHVRTGPYEVETSGGPRQVQEWRFEKQL